MYSNDRVSSKNIVEKFLVTISELMTALGTDNVHRVPGDRDPALKIGDEMLALMTDDVDWWVAGVPTNGGQLSKREFPSMIEIMREHSGGAMALVPTGWTIDGNRVAVEAYSSMKHKSGRSYNNRYHWLFEIRDNKISVVHEYHDTAHQRDVFQSMLVPSPP
jgi:uncharacterized protein